MDIIRGKTIDTSDLLTITYDLCLGDILVADGKKFKIVDISGQHLTLIDVPESE